MFGPYEFHKNSDGMAVYYYYPESEGRAPYRVILEISHRDDEGDAELFLREAVDSLNKEHAVSRAIAQLKSARAQ